jgi:hypothetical protein
VQPSCSDRPCAEYNKCQFIGNLQFTIYQFTLVEQSKVVRYLSIFFSNSRIWNDHKSVVYKRSLSTLSRTTSLCYVFPNCGLDKALHFYDAITASIYSYGVALWGFGDMGRFDSVQCKFIRYFFKLPKRTRNTTLLGETCRLCASCLAVQARTFLFLKHIFFLNM